MALSRSQMARMNVMLEQALSLDRAGRERWLRDLGPEDLDLEKALRKALLADTESGLLDTLPKFAPVAPMKPGDLVGPYRLMRSLGAGGMAEVWLAQRADGAFKREVALKIPAQSGDRRDLADRFSVERDILAALEHPNIARFYDAGVSGDGRPYLALEYVPGKNLLKWTDEHTLGIRSRIELFLQVLQAVQYAHDKGVLHRDIKPSNVLVTDEGQVRLLDFGVARLLERRGEMSLTKVYGQALTPAYASPEQLQGKEVDKASDVYSLGVMLYELMCGARPPPSNGSASSHERPSARVDEPAAVARATTASRLAHLLRGDIDAVVLKALAIDPAQRYDSASAFAGDLQRHLDGRPVRSRATTSVYRIRKFVGRHRVGAPASIAAAMVFVALGTYTFTHGLREAPQTPVSVTSNSAQSDAVADKSIVVLPFADISEKHDQEYFSDGLSEELIDRLTQSSDLKVIARTSAFAFKGKNEDVRSIAARLGVSHLLEGSVRKSGKVLRITAELVRASDGVHLWSQTYDRDLADIFKVQEDIARTVAVALKAALTFDESRSAVTANLNAYNVSLKARYFLRRKTKQDLLSALDLYQQAAALDPKYAEAWVGVSKTYASLGGNGWLGTAEAGRKARDAAERAIRIDPGNANAYNALGTVLFGFDGNWASAQANFRRASSLLPDSIRLAADAGLVETAFGRFDRRIEYEKKLIKIDPLDSDELNTLNEDLILAGRYEEAIEVAQQAIRLDPAFAGAHAGLAWPLLFLGRNDEALAAAVQETDDNWRLSTLPAVYWALERRADSDKSLQEYETRFADVSAYNIGEMHAYRGEPDLAFKWLDRAYRQQDTGLQQFRTDPFLQSLRKDQRYQALLVKLNLDGDPPP